MARMSVSRTGLDLIESFEGFRARSARLVDGRFTLGFGHVAFAREGAAVSREEAEDLLRWDLRAVEDVVRSAVHAPLTQNRFDALVSFAFNVGVERFLQSDVLRHLNAGEPIAAATAMGAWRCSVLNGRKTIVDALVRRRAAEAALFLEPEGNRPPAPTPVVTPLNDNGPRMIPLGYEVAGAESEAARANAAPAQAANIAPFPTAPINVVAPDESATPTNGAVISDTMDVSAERGPPVHVAQSLAASELANRIERRIDIINNRVEIQPHGQATVADRTNHAPAAAAPEYTSVTGLPPFPTPVQDGVMVPPAAANQPATSYVPAANDGRYAPSAQSAATTPFQPIQSGPALQSFGQSQGSFGRLRAEPDAVVMNDYHPDTGTSLRTLSWMAAGLGAVGFLWGLYLSNKAGLLVPGAMAHATGPMGTVPLLVLAAGFVLMTVGLVGASVRPRQIG